MTRTHAARKDANASSHRRRCTCSAPPQRTRSKQARNNKQDTSKNSFLVGRTRRCKRARQRCKRAPSRAAQRARTAAQKAAVLPSSRSSRAAATKTSHGANGESNSGPLAPKARIIPLDHTPTCAQTGAYVIFMQQPFFRRQAASNDPVETASENRKRMSDPDS